MSRYPGRKLCGARLDRSDAAFDRVRARALARGQDPERAVLARLRHRGFCTRPALPGSARCKWHGALSTAPVTAEGMASTIAAMKAGRVRWVADMRAKIATAEIDRFPCGRRAGGRNRTLEERAQAAHEKQCEREYRRIQRQARAVRRARKQELADLERHRQASHAGLPFWDDRRDLLESNLALTLDLFREHGTPAATIAELARMARNFVEHLSRPHALPPLEAVEAAYATIRKCEDAVGHSRHGRHGIRAVTDEEMAADRRRRERVDRAYDNYRKRRAVDAAVKQVAMARAAAVTEGDSPWEALARPISQTTLGNQTSAPGSQTVGTPSMDSEPPHPRELQRAYELSNLIVEAGRAAGRRFAGERVEPERRVSIAPWLASGRMV
jgi:hypothetical protein